MLSWYQQIALEDRTMKELVVTTLILTMVALAGIIHAGHERHQRGGESASCQDYMSNYPATMPTVMFDPITGINF